MTSKIEGVSAETVEVRNRLIKLLDSIGGEASEYCGSANVVGIDNAVDALLASGEVEIAKKPIAAVVRKFDMNAPMTDFQALRDKQALEDMHERMPAIMDELVKKRDEENEALAKFLTNQFLGYKLPKNFNPDAGVKFTPLSYHDYEKGAWISGTNLLDHSQAKEMFLRLLRPYSNPGIASGEVVLRKDVETKFSEIVVSQNLEPATDVELNKWRYVVMSKLLDTDPQSDGAFLLSKILKRLENAEKALAKFTTKQEAK